ncbi:MAG: patatin-like phospholipase family protein [Rhodothermales bacterium]
METQPTQPLPNLLATDPLEAAPLAADPFAGNFALCLSGGGYRAAAFHLGVLDVLTRLGLADRIRTLSTISGGTIVGAAYALSRTRDEPFGAFYYGFYEALRTRNVVAEAFDRLHEVPAAPGQGEHRGHPAPSLIRAAATVYADDNFVGDATLGDLAGSPKTPDELIFSATEFRGGRAFRFQTSRRAPGHVGSSGDLRIPDPLWRQIRLADVVAASSCFPIAFEPILFPDDFAWTEPLPAVRGALGDGYRSLLPLMDGGVYDNQGVDGVTTAYRRSGIELGWLLVSDSSPERGSEAFYTPQTEAEESGGLPLKAVPRLAAALLVVAALSLGSLGVDLVREVQARGIAWGHDLLVYGVPIALALVAALLVVLAGLKARDLMRYARDETGVDPWPTLREVSIRDLVHLVRSRLGSFTALTANVFMKRIRGLIQAVLSQGEGYKDRVAFNLIYDLGRNRPTLYGDHPELEPTAALVALARRSNALGTTLWFDREDDLRDLVACGQATACFTILEFLAETYGYGPSPSDRASSDADEEHAEAKRVLAEAGPLWARLKEDPVALLRERGEGRGPAKPIDR